MNDAAADTTPVEGVINPGRVLNALGAIGYTPESAICDIVDNSITHGQASKVWVELVPEPGMAESRRNSVSRYVVADNGTGLDADGLANALALGSDPRADGSLGKFGMGLKSAGLSLGRRIAVLSKVSGSDLDKRVLDVDHVEAAGAYVQLSGELDEFELGTWDEFLGDAESGTVIIIDKTHDSNQPSIKSTRQSLKQQLGMIYGYFLKGDDAIDMRLDGDPIEAFDPLFVSEAEENGALDEKHWDGKTTGWLSKPTEVTIDPERNVRVTVEMTQLPHPPAFEKERVATRQRYMIEAGNYGFYVYRNSRLISWGERFTDIVPMHGDYYGFRGRILIDDEADTVLNIDVKKSRVLLSEEARAALSDHVYEARVKSQEAWKHAAETIKKKLGENTQQQANEQLAGSEEIEVLPSDEDSPEIEERRSERRQRQVQARPVKEEEREQATESSQLVLIEDYLFDNVVWERAYDPEVGGTIVRLNGSHRFVRHIFQHYANDYEVTLVLNALFLCLARTESYAVNNMDQSDTELEEIFAKLRDIFAQLIGKVTQDTLEPALAQNDS